MSYKFNTKFKINIVALFFNSSIPLSFNLSFPQSFIPSIFQSLNLSIPQSFNSSIFQFLNPSILLSFYPSIPLSYFKKNYFLTAEQPAIVVILIASVAGRDSLRFTVSCTTFRVISSNTFSTIEPVCNAPGRP